MISPGTFVTHIVMGLYFYIVIVAFVTPVCAFMTFIIYYIKGGEGLDKDLFG